MLGVPIKHISLVVLTLQNSALILTMRYSRTLPGDRYLTSTAVILSELIKCIISLYMYTTFSRSISQEVAWTVPSISLATHLFQQTGVILRELFGSESGFWFVLVPSMLYTLQNNLQYVAASNLDAATFQVTYQGKILTTAMFAVLILRQRFTKLKWFAIFLLTFGVALVSIPSGSSSSNNDQVGNRNIGLIAVGFACLISGLAGVYVELIMKKAKDSSSEQGSSMWLRNVQLSFASLMIASVGAYLWNGQEIAELGFFHGYNGVVIATIMLQAGGGLIVAIVVTYADNILKGFATSLSMIISTLVSVIVWNFKITPYFLVGMVLVLIAVHLYGLPSKPAVIEGDVEKNTPETDALLAADEADSEKALEELGTK